MVEELKLAIKIDDATIEQSLLKQFANAQKMADKVVLDFKNVNFDDKQIEAKFKEMQKKAGQNPIDLTIGGNTLDMLGQIDKRLTEIFSIGKGKSFIDSSSTVADIGKIENKINELNKKYEEAQKKLSSIGSGNISGKDVNLVDNAEFQKLSDSFEKIKGEVDDLKTHMNLLDDSVVSGEQFIKLGEQVEGLSVKFDTLIDKYVELSNAQKAFSSTPQKTNISSENGIDDFNAKLQESKKYVNEIRQAFMNIVGKASNRDSLLNQYPELSEFKKRTNINKARSFLNTDEWKDFLSTLPQAHTYLESIGYDFDRIYKLSDEEIKWFKGLSPEDLLINGWDEKNLGQSDLKKIRAAYQNAMKDAFPKTSENLEQVAKSEQKVQQEAVATDKALDNISFTPNTEGFDDIIAKFGILREQAEQITKIVKTTKQTADGTPNISYKATLRNGSSYYLGENSTPQVLNASETVYDAKADNAKKLEREKQIWNELTTSLDRYATLQKRIASNNALSTDNEEATKLLEHIHELQRNDILPAEKLTASNEKLQQINQTVTDLKAKLKESTLDSLQGSIDKYQKIYDQRSTYSSDFTPSEQYTKNLIGLNTAIGDLVEYRNALKNVGEVTVEQEAYLKGLVAACEKASDSFKSLSASEKGTSQIGIDKLVQRINKDLDENTNYSKRAKLGLRALRDELGSANPRNLKEITSEIINIENAEIRAGRAGKSFFDIFKTKGIYSFIGQMQSYLSMYVGFYGMVNGVKKAVSTITELDTALVDLKKTTAMNENQLENFYYDSNNVAKQMGVTTKEIIDQASAWSRLNKIGLLYGDI